MHNRRNIKKQQWLKWWSNQFITNLNKGRWGRGGRTLVRIGVMGRGRKAMEKIGNRSKES